MSNVFSKRKQVFVLSVLLAFAVLITVIAFYGTKDEEKLIVGFVASGSVSERGWNGLHYEGIVKACEENNASLIIKENIKEGETRACADAIEELIGKGARLIILASYGYTASPDVEAVIKNHPNVFFFANSFDKHTNNLSGFFIKMYQARYLSGILAASNSESGIVGYVAAKPNIEVNRGINAFALGVKSVNPQAEIVVYFTNSWDDPDMEIYATNVLAKAGADVITCHQNQENVVHEADKLGIKSIGYHMFTNNMSDKYLGAVVGNWDILYKNMIQMYLQGNARNDERFWLGIENGVVALLLSDSVDSEVKKLIEEKQNTMLKGYDVFSGLIKDNNQNIICRDMEKLTDEVLLTDMDWYVEGVRLYE